MTNYKKIWIEINGPIGRDANNRAYEIHHINGNHSDDTLSNLKKVSIEEHFELHKSEGDWGACLLIAKRMGLSPTHLSDIQRGKKRPGIGGVKKGTVPWNKGKNYYLGPRVSEWRIAQGERNRKVFAKITLEDVKTIRGKYSSQVTIESEKIGKTQRNGRIYSYESAFSEYFSREYNVTASNIRRIIQGKSWKNVQ